MNRRYHAAILAAYIKRLPLESLQNIALCAETTKDESAEQFDITLTKAINRAIAATPEFYLSTIEYLVNEAIALDDVEQTGVTA